MLEVKTKESYDIILSNLKAKPEYFVQIRGGRKTVIIGNKPIVIYQKKRTQDIEINRELAKTIMKVVRASVTRYINKNLNKEIPLIPQKAPVIYTNKSLWNKLPVNTEFYLIDAKHCYWRIAYILGYISKNVYEKYKDNPEYKTLRNIALAILNTSIRREYYNNGEKINEIECDVSLYRQIYKNIRFYTYNNSGEIRDSVNGSCIGYRVDGLYLLKPAISKAKKIFEKNDLLYDIKKCIKIDNKNYSTGDGEIKKMV